MSLRHRYDNDLGRGDISQAPTDYSPFTGNLQTDEGLISMVEISLFTDRRAPEGLVTPGGRNDLRGWWGDMFWADLNMPGFQIGSLLWTLEKSKNRQETLNDLKTICEDAVAWMITEGYISTALAITERVSRDVAGFCLQLTRPGEETAPFWTPRWEKTINGI